MLQMVQKCSSKQAAGMIFCDARLVWCHESEDHVAMLFFPYNPQSHVDATLCTHSLSWSGAIREQ